MRVLTTEQYVGPDCVPDYNDACTRGGLMAILQEKEPNVCLLPHDGQWVLMPFRIAAPTQAEVLRLAFEMEEKKDEPCGDEEEGPGPGPRIA